MADNEVNRRTFERYKRFEFEGRFWKVQAPDTISTPGVIEIVALEDYDCDGDEMHLQPATPERPKPWDENEILGVSSVRPLESAEFTVKFHEEDSLWDITLPASRNKEVDDVLEYKAIGDTIHVTWTDMRSGSYILHYGDVEKTVNVESLF